ncbi:MAG: dienelactone hydrolase family protein [Acidimicrobiia bacterium]
MTDPRARAPRGDLAGYERYQFADGRFTHDVYRKGTGPVVMVITEMPGISPMVVGFADRVVALGCTAVLPDLFGDAGKDPEALSKAGMLGYGVRSIGGACISREFTTMAAGKSSPAVGWLRALAHQEQARAGGPGVGVVGMCFTGGFALAMAVDDLVVAPVLSQPSLPLGFWNKRAIDTSDADLATVRQRCAAEGLQVLGLRFDGDPFVPAERFQHLRDQLGDGFVAVELRQEDGHPDGPLGKHHSVLTGDLVDEPGEPTRAALDQVLDLFRTKLLVG